MAEQCVGIVDRLWHIRCRRAATRIDGGNWYCWTHLPSTVMARKQKAEIDRQERYRREAANTREVLRNQAVRIIKAWQEWSVTEGNADAQAFAEHLYPEAQ